MGRQKARSGSMSHLRVCAVVCEPNEARAKTGILVCVGAVNSIQQAIQLIHWHSTAFQFQMSERSTPGCERCAIELMRMHAVITRARTRVESVGVYGLVFPSSGSLPWPVLPREPAAGPVHLTAAMLRYPLTTRRGCVVNSNSSPAQCLTAFELSR